MIRFHLMKSYYAVPTRVPAEAGRHHPHTLWHSSQVCYCYCYCYWVIWWLVIHIVVDWHKIIICPFSATRKIILLIFSAIDRAKRRDEPAKFFKGENSDKYFRPQQTAVLAFMIIQRFWGVFWLRANIKHLFQCSKQTPAEHFKSNSDFSSFVSQRPRKRWTGYFFPFVQKLCLESESESPTKDLLLEKISWTLYCVVCFGLDFSALDKNTIVLVFMAKPPLARQYGHESNCHNIVLKPHFWCCYDKNERS